jgi:site-specific recombinase XerD
LLDLEETFDEVWAMIEEESEGSAETLRANTMLEMMGEGGNP